MTDRYEGQRRALIGVMQERGIRDLNVLRTFDLIHRHEFIPEAMRHQAYQDAPVPIGFGQTASQPSLQGLYMQVLDLQPTHKVLEVGTGCGFQTAVLAQLVRDGGFPRETLLNVNLPPIPASEVKGVQVTRLARRVYIDSLTKAVDPNGKPYFWIGGGEVEWSAPEGTDFHAINTGHVSVTPLHLDLTNHALLADVAAWDLRV